MDRSSDSAWCPAQQLEVGAKGGAFNGRLDGTFAYFAIEKRDLLITQLIDGIQTAQQIGKQTSHGIELALVGAADAHADASPATWRSPAPTSTSSSRSSAASTPIAHGQHAAQRADGRSGTSRRRSGSAASTSPARCARSASGGATTPTRGWSSGFTTIDAAVGYRIRHGSRIMLRGRNLTDRIYTQSDEQHGRPARAAALGGRDVHDRLRGLR